MVSGLPVVVVFVSPVLNVTDGSVTCSLHKNPEYNITFRYIKIGSTSNF